MASGKSSVTQRLHTVTSRPVLSLDQLVEDTACQSVGDIFETGGEEHFRRLEAEAIASLDPERPLVLDTGGGVVETDAAVAGLRERGVVIWLDAPWESLRERLRSSDPANRPLVRELGWSGLEDLYNSRRRLYAAAADFRLRTDRAGIDEVARLVMVRSLQWERRHEGGMRS